MKVFLRMWFFISLVCLMGCKPVATLPTTDSIDLKMLATIPERSDIPTRLPREAGPLGSLLKLPDNTRTIANSFLASDQGLTTISHHLTLFPNSEEALTYFKQAQKAFIPTAHWQTPTQIVLQPLSGEDAYELKCESSSISSSACTYIQQHGSLLIIVLANIQPPEMLTWQEFKQILNTIDTRMNQWPQNDLTPMPTD